MPKKNSPLPELGQREYIFKRVFAAPRDLVFQAWTDPKALGIWWGPHGFSNPRCEVDVRPGGAIRIDMQAPDGTVYPMVGAYREIAPPAKLVFVSGALDESGRQLFEILNTLTLTEAGDHTTLTLVARVEWALPEAAQYLPGMEAGWTQSLERLEAQLETAREIKLTRRFAAPRELVFQMWTDPVHLAQWWGPDGFTITTERFEFRPGGEWRFVMHGPDGVNYPNHIEFVEILAPERIAYRHVNAPPFSACATFSADGAETVLTKRLVFATAALRDLVAHEYHAVEGLRQTLGRLATYLARG